MEQLLSQSRRCYLMGFSILWIIGLHFYMYSAFPENSICGFLFGKGYLGVDVFLFLSAYGLCFSFNSNSLSDFYKRRLTRLFPAYLLFLIVTIWLYGNAYSESAWQLFAYQCTGIASFRQTDFEWYVPALIVVYATFPLFYKGISWIYKHCRQVVILLPIVLSLFAPLLSQFIFPLFVSRFPIMVLGVITYLALKDEDNAFLFRSYALCALFAIVTRRVSGIDYSLLIPAVLGLLSLAGCHYPFQKVVCFFGKHSLEIYLAQSLALNQFFYRSNMTYSIKCIIAFAIIVCGSVILCLLQQLSSKCFIAKN